MELLYWFAVFAISLFTLLKSSDFFIDSAEKVGLSLGIPAFVIGITIVALGTSLPELVSGIVAVLRNSSEIVASNVVGSNIANVLLVLGVIALYGKRLEIKSGMNKVDTFVLFGSAGLLAATVWNGMFSKIEALLFLALLIAYVWNTFRQTRHRKADGEKRPSLKRKTVLFLVASSFFIYLSADYNITSIIKLAEILNIGKDVIAMSAVALGTSLPELFVSISAVKKNNTEMALGNILGSNIFNILAVMSIPTFFGNYLHISPKLLGLSLPVMLLATVLYFLVVRNRIIHRWEGMVLVGLYAVFMFLLFR